MAAPAVTYTFANSTTADATQVNQNFTDLINGASDGTRDYTINDLSMAGDLAVAQSFATSGTSTVVATNGGSSTVAAATSVVILAPAGTIATYSLTLPASPVQGHRLVITSGGNVITALTLLANSGHSLATGVGVTRLRDGDSIELIFRSNVWYRVSRTCNDKPAVAVAYLSTSPNLVHDTSATIICDTEIVDNLAAYNNTTGVFTVPAGHGGIYEVGILLSFSTGSGFNGTTEFLSAALAVGGSTTFELFRFVPQTGDLSIVLPASVFISAAAATTLNIVLYQNSGGDRPINGSAAGETRIWFREVFGTEV